jgi:hypothetical protein
MKRNRSRLTIDTVASTLDGAHKKMLHNGACFVISSAPGSFLKQLYDQETAFRG